MQESTLIGIDLAKCSFQVHQCTTKGDLVLRQKLTREGLIEFMKTTATTELFMEACGGGHYWARMARSYGHETKLIAPQYVKPYVKRQKNDAADAEAICEAGARKNMLFVPIKTVDQQSVQVIHRIRSQRVKHRTALYNQVRGILHEFGIVVKTGMSPVKQKLQALFDNNTEKHEISEMVLIELKDVYEELKATENKIEELDKKINIICNEDDRCRRLLTIPGVGPITASAIVASVGNAEMFASGRHFAAWLGLVPSQHSTGGKTTLGKITKKGDSYLRYLLIHGARSILINSGKKSSYRSQWAAKLKEKKGMNKACIAMANKNARTIWALLVRGGVYKDTSPIPCDFSQRKGARKLRKGNPPEPQALPSDRALPCRRVV